MNGYLELEWKYEVITNVHKGSFSGDGNVLKFDCSDGYTTW